jgi:hypothetical protein
LWLLFGCGLLVAAVGEISLTYYDFGAHIHTQTQALNSDFFFYLRNSCHAGYLLPDTDTPD